MQTDEKYIAFVSYADYNITDMSGTEKVQKKED